MCKHSLTYEIRLYCTPMNEVLKTLQSRGFIKRYTDFEKLSKLLDEKKRPFTLELTLRKKKNKVKMAQYILQLTHFTTYPFYKLPTYNFQFKFYFRDAVLTVI